MAIQITKDLFMSLHVPAGACIPVASVSPIHVPPVQRVFSIVMCTHIYLYMHVIQSTLTPGDLNVYFQVFQQCKLDGK